MGIVTSHSTLRYNVFLCVVLAFMFATSATYSSEKADHSQLSNSVKKVRQGFNLSQAKVAAKIGVSVPIINRWKYGRATPLSIAAMPIEHLLQPMGEADKNLLVKHFLE